MEPEADFFLSYKAVSNKLKKRFMKKRNVAEARDEFNHLAKSLKETGCSQYAGFCCMAMAKCEQSMGNSSGETQALVQAARNFLQADESLQSTHCPNFREHLISAENSFEQAIKKYIASDLPVMAATLCEEIGMYLKSSQRYDEAATYYHRAAELYFQTPLLCLQAQMEVMHLKIITKEHYTALLIGVEILQQIIEKGAYKSDGVSLLGRFAELHCECEVTVVLLLMLIDPHPLKIKREFAEILQKYTWAESSCDQSTQICNRINENLFLLLQSVVMACASKDMSSLQYLQNELWSFLTTEQNSLVNLIIEEYKHPSGLGF